MPKMQRPRIIIAGGSGFIGRGLSQFFLARNRDVVVLTRGPSRGRCVQWDGRTLGDWTRELEGAFALINLTGKSINCRHTPENRYELIASRVNSVRALGEAIALCAQPPQVFVQAAGVGIYGDQLDRWLNENSPHGNDFVTEICEQWELAFEKMNAPHTRKVLLRLGIVLGPNGGFLQVLASLTRAFLGGHVGDGKQFISWIHIDDLMQMFLAALERDELSGSFNACSPNPVTNRDFMRELRSALHRPWSPPIPKFAARLGSRIIGTQPELALVSQRCTPGRFLQNNFAFQFPGLRSALAHLYP